MEYYYNLMYYSDKGKLALAFIVSNHYPHLNISYFFHGIIYS